MEKAIFISKTGDLKYVTGEYSRIYFGGEFCQNLIPDVEDLQQVLEFVSQKMMGFTLVTPFVTNKGMEKLKSLSRFMLSRKPEAEIVVNDWGFLDWLNREYPEAHLVLGRLLTKQKRGPRILKLMGKVPEAMIEHFQKSNADNHLISGFLEKKGVLRIEFDNLLQGLDRSTRSLKGSLYFPYVYVTTTRFCLACAPEADRGKPLRAVLPCNKECQGHTYKLRHGQMPVGLFLKGNTQFFKNDHLPEDLDKLGIDRIVYQPEIPI